MMKDRLWPSFPQKKFFKLIAFFASTILITVIVDYFSDFRITSQINADTDNDVIGDDYDPTSLIIHVKPKPWFFINGTRYADPAPISKETGFRAVKLLPHEDMKNDRFLNQMMFVPPNYHSVQQSGKYKTILANNGIPSWWNLAQGTQMFKALRCPVNTCRMTTDSKERSTADLIMFHDHYAPSNETRSPNQLYALYFVEPPFITGAVSDQYRGVFNWTITYRTDSTIPNPYAKWVYYDPRIRQQKQVTNYAYGREKKVAWFVSKCQTPNNRLDYAKELQKHIEVDIYGQCGNKDCKKENQLLHTEKCFEETLKKYKFYLAFENSNCKNYITEKFFVNGLSHNILPIVMGAPREDYERLAPERSFIHVEDFKSPKELAEYLYILDKSDELYNSYFKWKGTGEVVNAWNNLWCQMCAMVHDDYGMSRKHWYSNINDWWRGPGVCTKHFWRDNKPLNHTNCEIAC